LLPPGTVSIHCFTGRTVVAPLLAEGDLQGDLLADTQWIREHSTTPERWLDQRLRESHLVAATDAFFQPNWPSDFEQ